MPILASRLAFLVALNREEWTSCTSGLGLHDALALPPVRVFWVFNLH